MDLAKRSIQVHAVDEHERVVLKKSVKRAELLKLFANREPCLIGMEACGGAHYWPRELRAALVSVLEDAENGLSFSFRELLAGLQGDLLSLDERVAELTRRVGHHAQTYEATQRLMTIPGIGPIIASALWACIGDGKAFANGRQLAAFLGLTPKQHSTGGKTRLLGIHKHGDSYLRGLFVHGARAVQRTAVKKTDERSQWLNRLAQRRHPNIATVAQANKMARIAWAVLTRGETYQANYRQERAGQIPKAA